MCNLCVIVAFTSFNMSRKYHVATHLNAFLKLNMFTTLPQAPESAEEGVFPPYLSRPSILSASLVSAPGLTVMHQFFLYKSCRAWSWSEVGSNNYLWRAQDFAMVVQTSTFFSVLPETHFSAF